MAPTISFFPKFLPECSAEELAQLALEVGADGVDAVLRDGFAVSPANYRSELPRFARALRAGGALADLLVTDIAPATLAEEPDLLLFFADQGFKMVRMGYFAYREDVRAALREARETVERLVPMCALSGITAILQVHHGTLVSSASSAASLIRGLPEGVAVQLDSGNQTIEGYEAWPFGVRLLGKSLAAVGLKDVKLRPEPEWCELGEGDAVLEPLFTTLNETGFDGLYDLMPFYAEDRDRVRDGLRREVAFVRARLAPRPKRETAPRTLLDL